MRFDGAVLEPTTRTRSELDALVLAFAAVTSDAGAIVAPMDCAVRLEVAAFVTRALARRNAFVDTSPEARTMSAALVGASPGAEAVIVDGADFVPLPMTRTVSEDPAAFAPSARIVTLAAVTAIPVARIVTVDGAVDEERTRARRLELTGAAPIA